MTKQTRKVMALVNTNNARALMNLSKKQLARLAAPIVVSGAKAAYANRDVIVAGAKAAYNSLTSGRKRGNGALISHPQAIPGAIAAPVSYAYQTRGRKPKFVNSKGSVRITHREYLRPVDGGATFQVNNGTQDDFSINPLNPFLFPWLTGIAANFDQYTFRSLRMEYRPLIGTAANGRVAMFFDKDSSDPGPDDRAALANYSILSEISVWAIASLNIPVDNIKRFMSDNPTSDPKLINLGKLGWASYGNVSPDLGELFVEYTVELYNAQPTSPLLESLFRDSVSGVETRVGSPYFTLESASATQLVYQARVPGTYIITILWKNTTGGFGTSITAGGTINSSFGVSTTGAPGSSAFVANVTITRNANIALTGLSGATNAQIFATRAVKANVVSIT